ncbi:L30e-like protein [Clavulina sp. PMI_390]|nr:L30e-like protein [Clavulina sp. PMI_390]
MVAVSVAELSPIAKPLAGDKLNKKLHKTVKKAAKLRLVKRGVKEVVKSLKKGEKGILVLAGDITPLDIISHLPLLAEEASVPYVFVASKEELGHASATKRPTSCVMICPDAKVKRKPAKDGEDIKADEEEFKSNYSKCFSEIKELDESIVY